MNDFRDYDDYLMHYGIKGMHWGIRRYQPYPDGSSRGIFKNMKQRKEEKTRAYVEANKKRILKSPRKTMKYYDYLTREDINKAKQIKNDRRELASKGVAAIIAAAVTAAIVETTKETTKNKSKDILDKISNSKLVNELKTDIKRTFDNITTDAIKSFNDLRTRKPLEEFHQMTIDELLATLK